MLTTTRKGILHPSADLIVDELGDQIRLYWRTMHEFRRQANHRAALQARQALSVLLEIRKWARYKTPEGARRG